ncbi:adenylyl-sulfate kinase [uncultured Clostridium sp.]|uniref:adenylyl-sulfate kinase n=1 Tax=uncultured Clostridium sp. TaxID=59620 RepID=UPI0028EB1B89|nr:adenylyl-sulfate kinase [uncultured Clostridium sp.]
MKKKGQVYWFLGLSGSGKSTLSKKLYDYLKEKNDNIKLIDGDELREAIGGFMGYSIEERRKVINIIIYLVKTLSEYEIDVVVANISAFNDLRIKAREEIENYNEVYVKCSIEECARRDVKGYYQKALNEEIKNFIGIDQEFEEPVNPHLILNSENETFNECYQKLLNYINLNKL